MSGAKPPERKGAYLIGGRPVTRQEYDRYEREMEALRVKEAQLRAIVLDQMKPNRKR